MSFKLVSGAAELPIHIKSLDTTRDLGTSKYSMPTKSLSFTKDSGTLKYSIPKCGSPLRIDESIRE